MKTAMLLKAYILSDTNIYNAIYCLESYIFEKGLLSNDDLLLYTRLQDKYDFVFIEDVIGKCRKRLNEVVFAEGSELFNVEVYFKIKKWDDGKVAFRPMHTASLIDQICMVCLLLPLMFNDQTGTREWSELAKLIPHNFYGNIPSTDVTNLFEPWKKQYRRYNEEIIDHCRDYRKNHRYRTELTLDIKNFFPSISPEFIFNYVTDKLKFTYNKEEDVKTLKTVLSKLLFFTIKEDNLKGWQQEYYGEKKTSSIYMNCGIPQGLPQSYFFGNLCMIEIYEKLKRSIPEISSGDAYFYVDDSVIYVEQPYSQEKFASTLQAINEAVANIGHEKGNDKFASLKDVLSDEQLTFQQSLPYTIQFHEDGKSVFSCIDGKEAWALDALDPIRRATSMASAVYYNLDEIEDRYSKDKLEKIKKIVDDEIRRLKKNLTKKEEGNGEQKKDATASRLKMLCRYKRFFLFRIKLLKNRLNGGAKKKDIETFYEHFHINLENGEVKLAGAATQETWFDTFDEDIFQYEARVLLEELDMDLAKEFMQNLEAFEKHIINRGDFNDKYLFLAKDFSASIYLRGCLTDTYFSLTKWARKEYRHTRSLSFALQYQKLQNFTKNISNMFSNDDSNVLKGMFPKYTKFVYSNSDEFSRKILNAYYSLICDVTISDSKTFSKNSSRVFSYTEFRILARLRNRQFLLREFADAVNQIDEESIENRMAIDMGLIEVVGLLIGNVKDPAWIDNIIMTHRIVKGLWYNGSKFLNEYTLHNEEHAITLIKKVVRLVKAIDYLTIKKTDYYILFLACYLHDISMVIHPNLHSFCNEQADSMVLITKFLMKIQNLSGQKKDAPTEEKFKEVGRLMIEEFNQIFGYFEDKVRNSHAKDSADKIRKWQNSILNYMEPLLIAQVATVAESHGYDARNVYGLKSMAKDSVISEKYMMILIRLADLLDVANDRINYYLLRENVTHMNPKSQFHWISHLVTDEIIVDPTFEVDNVEGDTPPIEDRVITEKINVDLLLNVKFMATEESKGCQTCRWNWRIETETDDRLPEEYKNLERIRISMNDTSPAVPPTNNCPLICKWTMLKHEWLVNELVYLQRYLNTVNNKMFKTEIYLNIFMRDHLKLDLDFIDSVRDYTQGKQISL